jgi:lysophospholipase L1-like esterase
LSDTRNVPRSIPHLLKRLAVNAGIVLFATMLGVAAMEGIVRWKFPQPTGLTHQDKYGLNMHWAGITRFVPRYGHTVSFNSFGMRDREHEVEKAPGDFRVLVMGDSFMEAFQVPFEASMPALLEQSLAAGAARRVEVINAGVSGWGTDDELRYYEMYARRMKPDLVVVAMTLHNDVSDNLRQDWHTERDGQLVDKDVRPMPWLRYKRLQVQAFLSTRSQLYQLWRVVRHGRGMKVAAQELRSHVATLFDEPLHASTARGVLLTELLLARLDSIVRSDGGRLAVVLLPLQYQVSDPAFAEFSATFPDSVRPTLDRPQAVMLDITSRLGIPTVDLLPGFREWMAKQGSSLYVEGDGHWNVPGHRLATDVAAAALLERGLVPPAAGPVNGASSSDR